MSARGDRAPGSVIWDTFNTFTSTTGSLGTLSNGVLSIYKDGSDTQSTSGGSLTMNADGIVGFNRLHIDTSADGTFYAAGSDFSVILSAGSVGTASAAGLLVTTFSLGKGNIDFLKGSAVVMAGGLLSVDTKTLGGNTGSVTVQAGGTIVINTAGTIALKTDLITAAANATALLATVVDGTKTVAESFKINNAAAGGKLSGAPLAPVFRNPDDTKDRITATTDANGNRTAVSYDLS